MLTLLAESDVSCALKFDTPLLRTSSEKFSVDLWQIMSTEGGTEGSGKRRLLVGSLQSLRYTTCTGYR